MQMTRIQQSLVAILTISMVISLVSAAIQVHYGNWGVATFNAGGFLFALFVLGQKSK